MIIYSNIQFSKEEERANAVFRMEIIILFSSDQKYRDLDAIQWDHAAASTHPNTPHGGNAALYI